ncbi:hypothetical protein GCM10023330_27330 [Litoribaculum gwangyangense]|uniref:Uncharacterized protein n=1 Tax=Litoribaculum gwangyangense TaxID=1130722 RepID=A0ABP9CVD2_9FLAO
MSSIKMMLCSTIRFPRVEDSGSFRKIFSGTEIFKFESRFIIIGQLKRKYNSNTIKKENKSIKFYKIFNNQKSI